MSSEPESPPAALVYATERILRPRRPTYDLSIVLLSVFFIGMGAAVLPGVPPFGLLMIGVGGAIAAVPLVHVLPGVTYLRLGAEGFTVHMLFSTETYLWESVSPFAVEAVRSENLPVETVVAFTSTVDPSMKGTIRAERRRMAKRAGVAPKPPFHRTLSPSAYGIAAEPLAAIMNEWRERHLARSAGVGRCPNTRPGHSIQPP